ncbi:MAG: VWA domain-containing protein [Planctomycetes bacterium]|nr:VWA domain-containing protein [Planctomycetota bacterium]
MNPSVVPMLVLAAALAAQGPPPVPAIPTAPIAPATATAPRPIDLAICLDISGSMDGLIHQARQNLWAVVNDLATLQPSPTLRVALLTFGCSTHDAERGWVKVETGFTTDLDAVSQRLFALSTNGGDEYVARVVQTALGELQWSPDPGALKLLFVAGNEAATQDPKVDTAAQSRAAIARGIVVNSIYCGDPADTLAPAWRELAKLADGQFAAIEKDNAVVIVTPFDEQLAALSAAMNPTYVPYGAQREAWAQNQAAQDCNAASLNPAAAAQRCQTKASGLYANAHWDLVDACDDPKFKLDDVQKADLPEALRALTVAELRAHIAAQKQKRSELRAKAEELGRQREAFVLAEQKKLGAKGEALFDRVVLAAVRLQAEAKGFRRRVDPPPVAPTGDVESPFAALIEQAIRDYRSFVCVTGQPRMAPADCRISAPPVRRSAAEREHGQKLYLLYARFAEGGDYVEAGQPERVGQTLVKEAWQCIEGAPKGQTEAGRRYVATPTLRDGDKVWHAGDAAGLFVMHKLATDTKDTDQGWVYGAIDRNGVVTAAGRVASCMRCHQDATEDRRFGLR